MKASPSENKHRYTSSRLHHIISSIPYAFLSLFCKREKKLIVFCAMHCETFDSNSKFLFLHFLKNEPEYTVKFVINNKEKLDALKKQYGDHFIDTRTKEGKRIAISAATWIVSWLDLPIGGLFLRFRRYVLHLGHGTPLKCIGLLEKNGKLLKKLYYRLNSTNITNSLASTDFIAEIISKCMGFPQKRVLINGQPRTDALFSEKAEIPALDKKSFNIIYAPTWRHYAEVKLFPFPDFDLSSLLEFLHDNNIHLYIRFHPAYEEGIPSEFLKDEMISLFSAKQFPEVMDYINNFDALITDYSSIYLDYMLLERPILFLPYDLNEYEKQIGFTMDYEKNTPGPKPTTQAEFLKTLLEFKETPELYTRAVKELNKTLNSPHKNSCEKLASVIKERK